MEADYAAIVKGCRRRDRSAQRALYDALAPMALGVCMRFASDRDAAQDLMQDGFILVFEKIGSLREPQKLPAWVYHLMLNTCINCYRSSFRMESIDDVSSQTLTQELSTAFADPFANEEIVLAMQKLSPQQRMVFNLVVVEEFSFDEAAKELHCTPVTVRSILSRAKSRLREILTSEKSAS